MTKAERVKLLELYSAGPDLVASCLDSISKGAFDYSSGPERWSIRQIVFHIVDSDINGNMRLRKPLAEPETEVPIYNEELWVQRLHVDAIPIDSTLDLFRAFRTYNAAYFEAIAEDEWLQTVIHPEWGRVTLEYVLHVYANHPGWHIEHINRTHEVWKRAEAGEVIDPTVSLWVPPK